MTYPAEDTCDVCGEVRPIRSFMHLLTPMQAEYIGHPNPSVGVRVFATTCNKCTGTTDMPAASTTRMLQRGAEGERVSFRELLLAPKEKEAARAYMAEKAREAMTKVWERRADEEGRPRERGWNLIKAKVQEELRLNRFRRVNYVRRVNQGDAQAMRMVVFLDAYSEALRTVRANAGLHIKRGTKIVKGTTWEDILTKPVYRSLCDAWSELPADLRLRAALPAMLNVAEPEHGASRSTYTRTGEMCGLQVKRGGGLHIEVIPDDKPGLVLKLRVHKRNRHNYMLRKLPNNTRLTVTYDQQRRVIDVTVEN